MAVLAKDKKPTTAAPPPPQSPQSPPSRALDAGNAGSPTPTANPYSALLSPTPTSAPAGSGGSPSGAPPALTGSSTNMSATPASAPPSVQTGAPAAPGPSGAPKAPPSQNTQAAQPGADGVTAGNASANPYTGMVGGSATNTNATAPVGQLGGTPSPPDKPYDGSSHGASSPETGNGALVEGDPYGRQLNAQQAGAGKLSGDAAAAMGIPGNQAMPSATGHVNFDQLYGANAGVAKRESDKRVADAMAQAKKAQGELAALQQQFTQATQVGGGPTQSQQDWASYGSTGVADQNRTMGYGEGDPVSGKQGFVSEQDQGLSGGEQPVIGPNGEVLAPGSQSSPYDQSNAGADEAAVRAGAAVGDYHGPGSLSEMDPYQQLLNDTKGAQDNVTALQSDAGLQGLGMGATDAALVGGAGRSRFTHLQDMYNNLQGGVDAANKASLQQGADAASRAGSAKDAYQQLLDQYNSRVGGDQARSAETTAHNQATDAAKASDDAWTKYKQSYYGNGSGIDAKTNKDGELVWGDDIDPAYADKMMGADMTYTEARGKAGAGQGWVKSLGVKPEDADFVTNSMTQQDWAAYKTAAARGPDAARKWFDGILSRRKN